MKNLIKKLLFILNKILLSITCKGLPLRSNTFFKFSLAGAKGNELNFKNTQFETSDIVLKGLKNRLYINAALVSKSSIRIDGENNRVIVHNGVKLRSANIIIRGNNCLLEIGKNTTFGGIRIINAGESNSITIGEDCLFADQIELWASDTHAIYDDVDTLINKEKPVVIGNKVWIGSRVIILKGTTIADGSIVGMGSLVVKDVPARSISVGSPNRVVKENVKWAL